MATTFPFGTPPPTWARIRTTIDHAEELDDALELMDTGCVGGMNNIISDGTTSEAVIREEIWNYTYIGTYDSSDEDTSPFWTIDNVIRRKNMFIHSF